MALDPSAAGSSALPRSRSAAAPWRPRADASLSWGFAVAVVVAASALAVAVSLAVPLAQVPAVTAVVTALSVVVLAAAAARRPGRTRLSWGLVAAAAALWTASLVVATLGGPDDVVWWWLRPPGYAAALAGVLTSPGVRRSLPEWGVLLLDGVLFAAATAGFSWYLLGTSDEAVPGVLRALPEALVWVPADVLALSLVVGLGLRAGRETRPQAALVVVAAVGTVLSDTAWALTGQYRYGVAGWLAVVVTLAAAGLGRRLDMWVTGPAENRPVHVGRLSQVAAVPTLVTAVLAPADPVLAATSLTVLVALALQLLVLHRQNGRLWEAVVVQARRLDELVTDSRDALIQVDGGGCVVFASDAVHDVFGVRPYDMLGRPLGEWLTPGDPLRADGGLALVAPLLDGSARRVVARGRVRHSDGTWRYTESVMSLRDGGEVPGFTISCRDTTEAEELAAEVRLRARTDSLTGLLSRAAFLATVEEQLAAGPACVLFVDLDGFKEVNDTSGHAAGDRLLRDVAAALAAAVGPGDVVARLGGDEFAVLAAGGTVEHGLAVAAAVLDALPVAGRTREGTSAVAGASIGVAAGPADGAESLLGHADLAMYEAKAAGGGRAVAFEPRMRTRILARARTVAELDAALAADPASPGAREAVDTAPARGLDLHVQPIVALPDGTWTGFEALVRWRRSSLGAVPPAEFVPVAEERGLIQLIGAYVLGESLVQLARWRALSSMANSLTMSVNLSPVQARDPGHMELLRHMIADSGVPADRVKVEITESVFVDLTSEISEGLIQLRNAGVQLVLDDFGTGYSSLNHLQALPFDGLKVDRSFVVRAMDDPRSKNLVRSIASLARGLDMHSTAEGVELVEQRAFLTEVGFDFLQGFLFGRPTPNDQIDAMVVKSKA